MLKTNTTTPLLYGILNDLMKVPELHEFRLVGGTALSLQLGHRFSVDIDLFTYQKDKNKLNFDVIENSIKSLGYGFYYNNDITLNPDIIKNKNGIHIFLGNSESEKVKIDILDWSEDFFFDCVIEEGIRMASIEEIITMKLEVISRGGRKKDFWDISEFLEKYTIKDMLDLYQKKYCYSDVNDVIGNFTNFSKADN